MTRLNRSLAAAVLAAGFALAMPALAASDHSHDSRHGGGLALDHGRKWQTDAPLRQGMALIRDDIAAALDKVHANRFAAAEYDALAKSLEGRIEAIARDCRLPEATDAQLHIVLAAIMDGMETMRGKSGQRSQGVVAVVKALDGYQAHFDHPGWTPVRH